MDIQASLRRAQSLYHQGQYADAATLVNSLATEENAPFREIFLMNAKCLIRMAPTVQSVKTDVIGNALASAAKETRNVPEMYDLMYELDCAYEDWHREQVIDVLAKLSVNPTLEGYQAYTQLGVKYIMANMQIHMGLLGSETYKSRVAEAGLTPKEATAQYQRKAENAFTDDERKVLEFDVACTIFNNTKAKLESGKPQVARDMLGALFVAEFLASHSADEKLQVSDEVKLARLKTAEDMIRYRILAKVNTGNGMVYLFNDTNNSGLTDLQKVQAKIKAIDPSYTPAEPPKRQVKKSGCYVATAVYGSYDCPQVWTLRRFRDDVLAKSWCGRAFIRTYYAVSPTLVKWFGQAKWFQGMWRPVLNRMVDKLQAKGMENTPYEDRQW